MANSTLFRSMAGALLPRANARNDLPFEGAVVRIDLSFQVVSEFATGRLHSDRWVRQIEAAVI